MKTASFKEKIGRLGVYLFYTLLTLLASGTIALAAGPSVFSNGKIGFLGGLPPALEKLICERALKAQGTYQKAKVARLTLAPDAKIDINKLQTVSYYALEIGDYDLFVRPDWNTGIRRAGGEAVFHSAGHHYKRDFSDPNFALLFMPNAVDNQAAYYAVQTVEPGGQTKLELHSLDSRRIITEEINDALVLVWETYHREGTVPDGEIAQFQQQEDMLDPIRKMAVAKIDPVTKQSLSVMRVYDGTPFPGVYFVDFGEHFDYDQPTDARVPVERRYTQYNFRRFTEFVFEMGRLAKHPAMANALETHFVAFAGQLVKKYGYRQIVPTQFLKGRIYIEITGRNLDKFLRPRDQDGYGFKLFKKPPVKPGEPAKYLLYATVKEFIKNYHTPVRFVTRGEYTEIVDVASP
jgi:hypothetical protein